MENQIIEIARESVYVLLKVSLPILITTLVVGLIISLFQALTQIQEQTLVFIPKIISVMFGLLFFASFMYSSLKYLFDKVFELMAIPS